MSIRSIVYSLIFGLLVSMSLSSCGGGGGDSVDPVAYKVTVSPNSSMVTQVGEGATFTATSYSDTGATLSRPLSWSSSNPTAVSVDEMGQVTCLELPSSALITASADGVVSNQVMAMCASPSIGAVLVDDDQVVGDYSAAAPNTPWGEGSQYSVTLSELPALSIGDILLSTGEEPIGGRVVSTEDVPGGIKVTLEIVGLDVMFDQLKIDAVIDLSNQELLIPSHIASQYYVTEGPGGRVDFTLKEGADRQATQRTVLPRTGGVYNVEVNFPPFECKGATTNPLALVAQPPSFSITRDIDFIFNYDGNNGGLQELGIDGLLKGELKTGLNLAAAFEGKITCEAELGTIPIRLVGGPIMAALGPSVPVGVGFELGGKLTLAQMGVEVEGKLESQFEAIIQTPGGIYSGTVVESTTTGELKPKLNTPPDLTSDLGLLKQIRLEPAITAYAYASLDVGINLLIARLTATLLKAKGGLKESGNLAVALAQAEDTGYKSSYGLNYEIVIGTGDDLNAVLGWLRINMSLGELLKIQEPWAISPKEVSEGLLADHSEFEAGEVVSFKVKLDPDAAGYPHIGYNVDDIELYRLQPALDGGLELIPLATHVAAPDQLDFTIYWTADEAGTVEEDIFAFLTTKALSLPYFGELELGVIEPPPDLIVIDGPVTMGDNSPGLDTSITVNFEAPEYYPVATLELSINGFDIHPTQPKILLNGVQLGIGAGDIDPDCVWEIDLTDVYNVPTCIFRGYDDGACQGPYILSEDVSFLLRPGQTNTLSVETFAPPVGYCDDDPNYDDLEINYAEVIAK